MNLVGDPWIPVVLQDGGSELVSLRDAFARGEEIRDLAVNPPQRIALTRLLVCVAQAALDGPADEEDWAKCAARIAPEALSYLDRHRDAFRLYAEGDEGAFLQVPNLEPTDNAVVDKLDFGLAAGNNATLFDQNAGPEGREIIPPAWQALGLLTYQCFSPGGTIGVTRWDGVWTTTDGRKPRGSGKSGHAPCLAGGPLHTIVRALHLTGTIQANLLSKERISQLPSPEWGRPVWEILPSSAADPHAEALMRSYLGRMVPITRAVRLSRTSRKITICNGLSYAKFPEARESSTTVILKADGTPTNLRIDVQKHPWRELASLLAASPSRMEGRALILHHLRPGKAGFVDIWTGGLAADKGKVIDVAEWSFVLPLSMLGDMELQTYQKGADLANRASGILWAAVSAYWKDLKLTEAKTKKKKNDRAAGLYWSRLDAKYGVLITTTGDPTLKIGGGWYREVWNALAAAYENACPHATPRQIRAYARGRRKLRLKRPEG